MKSGEFLLMLDDWYQINGRHGLPWRQMELLNPYAICVSEVMLQQTQVARVVGYFCRWMELFPDIYTLASASTRDVLLAWQGLGYNNRGLRLQKLAQVIVNNYSGQFPRERSRLEKLPGIGPYTAGAIRAFVWNEPDVFVETNIRRVIIHEFIGTREQAVSDQEVLVIVTNLMQELVTHNAKTYNLSPRTFYWALMDYGATLPKVLKTNPNTQSKHYAKQSRFEGSVRQVRSGILKWLLEHNSIEAHNIADMLGIANSEDSRIMKALQGLERDGLIRLDGATVSLLVHN